MTKWVRRIGGMTPKRKSRSPQRRTNFKAILSISNPTSWPGTEPRNEGLYNYCVFQVNNDDLLNSISKIPNGEWKTYVSEKT